MAFSEGPIFLCYPVESQNKQMLSRTSPKNRVMLELEPLKTFGQMPGPLCVQRYKFSQELSVPRPHPHPPCPSHTLPTRSNSQQQMCTSQCPNSCHLLSLGSTQVLSEENPSCTSSLRKHVPNYTANVFSPGGGVCVCGYSPQDL